MNTLSNTAVADSTTSIAGHLGLVGLAIKRRLEAIGCSKIITQPRSELDLTCQEAVAKIAGIEMCWAFNRQYETVFLAVMPTNLYGPNDSYDLNTSHVLAALIRKMHEAKQAGTSTVNVWGTGSVRREFLHSDDLAQACVFLMNLSDRVTKPIFRSPSSAPLLNVGCGEDATIRELAELIAEIVRFEGRLEFDPSKPGGTARKVLDISKKRTWAGGQRFHCARDWNLCTGNTAQISPGIRVFLSGSTAFH
jgi:nucleoside-diphosphate-sugar epimerase